MPPPRDFLAHKCLNRRLAGYLILRKITKFVASRCHILRVKCIISAGAAPQTPLGGLQRSPRPLAGFNGPTSKGR